MGFFFNSIATLYTIFFWLKELERVGGDEVYIYITNYHNIKTP